MFIYTTELQVMASSGLLTELDTIYIQVLEHVYGHSAAKFHPFVLLERTPLHLLIQLNVILLGSPMIGHKLVGYVHFFQLLRQTCAIVSFECLQKAFERSMLATSSFNRQLALIIQAALLLDQVFEMNAEASSLATCFAHRKHYQEMHQHLVQYISFYLQKLVSGLFGKGCSLIKHIRVMKKGGTFSAVFWDDLASLIPSIPLAKPQKLRRFADSCSDEVNLEDLYRKLYI
jgi:hypothetical protein